MINISHAAYKKDDAIHLPKAPRVTGTPPLGPQRARKISWENGESGC